MSTLCDPRDSSPPGILQARTLDWVAISFSNAWKWKVKVKLLSRVRLLATPWTAPTRLLCPWDFPGKSTGVRWHRLLFLPHYESSILRSHFSRKWKKHSMDYSVTNFHCHLCVSHCSHFANKSTRSELYFKRCRISTNNLVSGPHFTVIDCLYNFEFSYSKLLVLLPGIGFNSAVCLNLLLAHWFLVYTSYGTGSLISPPQW